MSQHALPESMLRCPCCGERMSVIEVTIARPPYRMELAGCIRCGVTSNEAGTAEGGRDISGPPDADS